MSTDEFEQQGLLRVPTGGPGRCGFCFQPSGTWPNCASCHGCFEMLVSRHIALLPVALRLTGTPLAFATWNYKNSPNPGVRQQEANRLRWLLDHYMPRHERCLVNACADMKVDAPFDVICPIPSSQGRDGEHPLVALLKSLEWANGRVREALQPGEQLPPHVASEDRFVVDRSQVEGRSVLVFDDTLTRGANMVSAVNTLRSNGATAVAAAVIGRHFRADYSSATARYADHARQHPFTFHSCVYCDTSGVDHVLDM